MKHILSYMLLLCLCISMQAETRYWLMNKSANLFGVTTNYVNDGQLNLQNGLTADAAFTKSYRYALPQSWWTVNMNLWGYNDFTALNTGDWWLKVRFRSDNTEDMNVILKQTGTSRCFKISKSLCDGDWHVASFRLSDYPGGALTFADNEAGTFFQLNSSEQRGSYIEIESVFITDTETPEVMSHSKGLGILSVKDLVMYNPNNHLPDVAGGVKNHIDLYVVNYGDNLIYKQVSKSQTFDGAEGWRNQVDVWRVGGADQDKVISSDASLKSADSKTVYSPLFTNGLFGYGDAAIQLNAYAKMWGGNGYYSELMDYHRGKVNTSAYDYIAPSVSATFALTAANEATISFSDASEDVFYYVEYNYNHYISFFPTIQVPAGETAYPATCYAVDYDGNLSEPIVLNIHNRFLTLSSQTDNSAVVSAFDTKQVEVTVERTLVTEYYNTLCLPFAMSEQQVNEVFGEGTRIALLSEATMSGETLNLTFEYVYSLEAGVPYLIQPTESVTSFALSDVLIEAEPQNIVIDGVIEMVGIMDNTSLPADDHNILFLVSDNTLTWPSETGSLRPLRAYFHLLGSTPALAHAARIVFQKNTATDVDNLVGSPAVQKCIRDGRLVICVDGNYYSVTGQIVK